MEFNGPGDLVAFIPSMDLLRSAKFYGDVLGLEQIDADNYALVYRSGSTDVRVTAIESLNPQPFTVLGWNVVDMSYAVAQLGEAGVEFVRYEGMDQDPRGVWMAPGGAQVAWFRDPDGNVLSLTRHPA
jgi:catechol 2,3-dioxygenase-like lactoylglutathione lyase family enzyme